MAAYRVEYEDFAEALKGVVVDPETVAGWIAEVLVAGQENRKLQDCFAGLLREVGWICAPPTEQPTPPAARRKKARG